MGAEAGTDLIPWLWNRRMLSGMRNAHLEIPSSTKRVPSSFYNSQGLPTSDTPIFSRGASRGGGWTVPCSRTRRLLIIQRCAKVSLLFLILHRPDLTSSRT